VVFVVDDLGAWLVGLLADAGLKKLTTLVLGSDQERALRQAAKAAIARTAGQLAPSDGERAQQLATAIGKVFRDPAPDAAAVAGQATLLEALQAGIAGKLAVLDDRDIIGTGQSSAELVGLPGGVLAETLAGHLVREIMVRGSGGGALAPLADQLNHDVTHLQGQRLEGMLAQLVGQVMELAQASGGPRKPVRLPPRPTFLVGREELLAGLDTRLAGGDGTGPQTVALSGLGGTGKTSVALECAYRHLAEVGVAWQFAAEDATVLAAGFNELAAQLGAQGTAGARDPVASVHAVLAMFATPWLLIFDNAADLAAVAAFLPPAGPGRVLITSQNPNWPHDQAMHVPLLGAEVAADLLVSRANDPDRQSAQDLAGELGGLPLALEQAAAYVHTAQGTLTLAEYLVLFRQRRAELLGRGEPTGYDKTVATTWRLAFEDLAQAAPGAAGLLRLLAFCAPEAIPLRLLLQPREVAGQFGEEVQPMLVPLLEDPLAAGDAIAALRRYSLVTPAGGGSVSVHRLVQAVTADQMPAELSSQWRQAAAALIGAAIPAHTELPHTWSACAALLPHVQAALSLTSNGMWRIATYLGCSGSYLAAQDLCQQIADTYGEGDDYGPEHPDTLAARAGLANWTGAAGDAVAARQQYATLLLIREQVLGPEHPDTLTGRADLARWTGEAGYAAGARNQFAALLPVEERVLGPEDPQTLAVRGNLAYWTGAAGDAAGARNQFAALLPIRERVLGTEHPATLTASANLARWTGEAGDAAGARDQFAVLLAVRERVLGPEHPDTLTDRANLAHYTGTAGDAAGARDQYAELLPIEERVLGPEHPETLVARANLATWTRYAAPGGN
jgi:hypothetical protein